MTDLIYRPGLDGVVAGETAISTIEGGLRYRGYPVEELADRCPFEDVAYLILYGDLPAADQRTAFVERLGAAARLEAPLIDILRLIPAGAPMMDVLRTGASLLAHWDLDIGVDTHAANLRKAERLLAQLPLVMAACHRLRSGEHLLDFRRDLSFAGNVLWLLTGRQPSPRHVKAMDVSLILYAEHEYNASAFAARVVSSTLSDIHSAVSAAIGALKGPLHGGANEQVMRVLQEAGTVARAEDWVRDALSRKVKIMGFGHRVYKTGDPRARYLKKLCTELAAETGHEEMEAMAERIEQIVTAEKGLPPNLDWPSARLYHYMKLPLDLYTPLFVISRVTGWSAHVIEQLDNNRLIRPRARYVGQELRHM
jgi:citrate synthase